MVFSLLLPRTFPTILNARTILNDKSVVALLALAAMIPMSTDNWDLTVGFGVGLTHIAAMVLLVELGFPWWVAVLIPVLIGMTFGLINGLLVTKAQIHSFIATLGVGTVLAGLAAWYTGGRQVVGEVPSEFLAIASTIDGIPLPAIYVLLIGTLLWIAFEYLPIGRHFYVIGSNPRAAGLTGIRVQRNVILAFMASGTLTGFAGVVLASRLHVGQVTVGPDFMLPAFTGAMLGATVVRPGRVNAIGTVVAVLVLAVAVAGLQQMGASFWVEPLFNGFMLVTAVGLAGYASRRRSQRAASERAAALAANEGPSTVWRPDQTEHEPEQSPGAASRAHGPWTSAAVEPALGLKLQLGESPVWDASTGVLYVVDIPAGRVISVDVEHGSHTSVEVGQPVGAVAPRLSGGLVAACRDGFGLLDPASGRYETIALVEDQVVQNRMNDGKVDPSGRFWAGTQATDLRSGAGALYRLDQDRGVTQVLSGVTISNGIAWSPDHRTMYYIDTATGGVDAFDYDDSDGTVRRRRRLVDVSTGEPDGMTVDADGRLWVALWGGWAVHCYTPDGKLDGVLQLPVSHVTSCAFGGSGLTDLFVTTSSHDEHGPLPPDQRLREPLAGTVFVAQPGTAGIPAVPYRG